MIRLGGPDTKSIRLLVNWPGGLFYRPDVPFADYTRIQIEKHFLDGSSVFQDGDEFEKYFVSRVRNYGHVESLHQAQVRHAVVRGSCHEKHFVATADAASWIKWFRDLSQQEYEKRVFGRDHGFPPFGLGCNCVMEGLIPGTPDFHQLNVERKRWNWLRRFNKLSRMVAPHGTPGFGL